MCPIKLWQYHALNKEIRLSHESKMNKIVIKTALGLVLLAIITLISYPIIYYGLLKKIVHIKNDVHIIDYYGKIRCLSLSTASNNISSCININNPELIFFDYIKKFITTLYINPDPQNILVLGLGGGTLPMTLHKILPQSNMDIVEINADVISAAKQYFLFREQENMKVYLDDALHYITLPQNVGKYDIVFVDLYDSHGIIKQLQEPIVLKTLLKLLASEGMVAVNWLMGRDADARIAYDKFLHSFCALFPYCNVLTAGNNFIIIGTTFDDVMVRAVKNQSMVNEKIVATGIDKKKLWQQFVGAHKNH